MEKVPHHECQKSELLYDDPHFYQTDILEDYTQYVSAKNSLIPNNPITFDLENSSDFVDLSQTQLRVVVQITKGDGGEITEEAVCPVNNLIHSLFSNVQVSLKDNVISHSNSMYPYRAYLESLLTYSVTTKKFRMVTQGWEMDETGKFDASSNSAITKRKERFKNAKFVELKSRLHIDLSLQEKLLPSNLDIKITLTPTKPEFVLMSHDPTPNYKVIISDATLYVRKVKINPARQIAFEQQIAKNPIRIPISYVSMKNISLASGISSFNQDGIITGPLPTLCILGFVPNNNFVGTYVTNPFNFKHFGVNSLGLRVNGRNLPSRALTPDYDNDNFIDAYQTLFSGLGVEFDDFDNAIDYDLYKNGCCLYAFNLTPDNCPHNAIGNNGSLDLSVRFKSSLTETITLVCYAQYQNNIFIDQHRNCFTDIHN